MNDRTKKNIIKQKKNKKQQNNCEQTMSCKPKRGFVAFRTHKAPQTILPKLNK